MTVTMHVAGLLQSRDHALTVVRCRIEIRPLCDNSGNIGLSNPHHELILINSLSLTERKLFGICLTAPRLLGCHDHQLFMVVPPYTGH